MLGQPVEVAIELGVVRNRYERMRSEGFVSLPFEMSLAQLRFIAACAGVFDLSDPEIMQLGLKAHRLAEAGSSVRQKREVESRLRGHFGLRLGGELV
ncbi:MAG: hypothetical protein ACR2PL_05880 [Dehalococcoidia bacterium]